MKVTAGEEIREIKSGKNLVVERDFDSNKDIKPTSTFDFLARYSHSAGITRDGAKVYGNRGLSLSDEGIVWERV